MITVGCARDEDLDVDPVPFLPWESTLALRVEPVRVFGRTECCPGAEEAIEAIEECEDDSDNSTSLFSDIVDPTR